MLIRKQDAAQLCSAQANTFCHTLPAQARPNSNAILICNETTTPAFYRGKDKHRLVTNVIFRWGGAPAVAQPAASMGGLGCLTRPRPGQA